MAIQAITMLNIKERERVDPLFQNDLWVVGRGVNNAAISNVNLAFSMEIFLVESTFFFVHLLGHDYLHDLYRV